MKPALLVASLLLLGTAPSPPEAPVGRFQTWGVDPAKPLRFRSGGLVVSVAAAPCPSVPQSEGCSFDGVNNQATITVAAPGLPPFTILSDRQAAFVRVAAVQLDRCDQRRGVVIDNQWGGSGGITTLTVIEPVAGGFRAVPVHGVQGDAETWLKGELADFPRDRSGDGIVDYVLQDARFEATYGCNACTPRPPRVLSVVDGHEVDLSTTPAVRPVFAADMVRVRAACDSGHSDRNGSCAAYLADAARLGEFAAAWRDMLAHYERDSGVAPWQDCRSPRDAHGGCPSGAATQYRDFPESVRAFLVRTGYITTAQAVAAPLS